MKLPAIRQLPSGNWFCQLRLDEDGFASIYINSRLSEQTKKAAFLHEIWHIRRNDHYNLRNIREVERCHARKSKY